MSFEKKIASKTDFELAEILENRENYVPQFVEFAEFELSNRSISVEEFKEIAKQLVIQKVKEALKSYSPLKGKFNIPSSHFLTEEEVLAITKVEFEAWLERKEDFGFDVWKYAVGAIA
ncbi:hypothetical protein [Parvicella tangerina]|uniref:Uncharacterized protein n=1 Tax=Parvicella tangerina TaxID=2829795 RepID=A0A916NT69_9FLAO|nr:hypothetical protein [Parvicella tangerina]CAG5085407.1 hypothetical protein CRYO30217_02750 [Parvicella tangerina]